MSKKVGPFVVDPGPDDYTGAGSETDMAVSKGWCLFWAVILLLAAVGMFAAPFLLRGS